MTRKTVLLVEPDLDCAYLVKRALGAHGVLPEVVEAHDGEQALDCLLGNGSHGGRDTSMVPDAILLSLDLPGMHGLEVLRSLRQHERTRLVPIVVFTDPSGGDDLARCYEAGCNSYIRKPVSFERFGETVVQVARYWTRCNEPPPRRG